jgi:hypothetical protein
MKKGILLFILLLLTISPAANAQDISGRWYVTANGWNYVMDLTQQGKQIFGTCIPQTRNRELDAVVYGEINEGRINLDTNNQNLSVIRHFKGALFTSQNGWAIAGVYTENNRHGNRWHAIKYN